MTVATRMLIQAETNVVIHTGQGVITPPAHGPYKPSVWWRTSC